MPTVVLCTAGYDHTIRFWEATTATSHRAVQFSDSVSEVVANGDNRCVN
jgi:hypothetical protein